MDLQKTKAKAAAAAKPKKAAAAPKAATKKTTQTTLTSLKHKAKAAPKKRAKPMSDDEDDVDDSLSSTINNESVLSRTPPSAKKQKKAPVTKKSAGKPLAELENESMVMDNVSAPSAKQKTASEKYQKARSLGMCTHGLQLTMNSSLTYNKSSNVQIPILAQLSRMKGRCGCTTPRRSPWSFGR